MSQARGQQALGSARATGFSRRRFVKVGAGAALAGGLIVPATAVASPGPASRFRQRGSRRSR